VVQIINEPWAGDVFSDPLLFLPAVAGAKNLMPLYNNVTKAIRQVDSQHMIFYEVVYCFADL
jgi:endoglycosylceramidase